MKLSILLELISATVVVATSEIPPWHPPRDGEGTAVPQQYHHRYKVNH